MPFDIAVMPLWYGPTYLFVAAATITTVASVYCAVALRMLIRRSHYAWGEASGRITQLERALEAEQERLRALRRIITRGERKPPEQPPLPPAVGPMRTTRPYEPSRYHR